MTRKDAINAQSALMELAKLKIPQITWAIARNLRAIDTTISAQNATLQALFTSLVDKDENGAVVLTTMRVNDGGVGVDKDLPKISNSADRKQWAQAQIDAETEDLDISVISIGKSDVQDAIDKGLLDASILSNLIETIIPLEDVNVSTPDTKTP